MTGRGKFKHNYCWVCDNTFNDHSDDQLNICSKIAYIVITNSQGNLLIEEWKKHNERQ